MRVAKVQQDHIDKRFDKLDGNISKLGWLIGAGIASAFVSFLLNGGLAGGA